MKKILLLAILGGSLIACKNNQQKKDAENTQQTEEVVSQTQEEVLIKLKNKSGYDYENIIITNPTDKFEIGSLKSGEESDYKTFKKAYSYVGITLEVDGKTYTFQPIDYVSETPLKEGKYTYAIDLKDLNNSSLDLELSKDNQ